VEAQYYGLPTVVTRNPWEISLANFTVKSGENRLSRPVGGGHVESGALKGGSTNHSNLSRLCSYESGKHALIFE
jgi:alkaline phosphatase D